METTALDIVTLKTIYMGDGSVQLRSLVVVEFRV
jgi:hypothetical protein